MNKFSLNQQSSTVGSIVIMSGILAYQPLSNVDEIHTGDRLEKENYILDSSSPTFSEYGGFTKSLLGSSSVNDNFEQLVGEFYSKLLANQESLGEEFEEVLFNNLWDLYED